MFSRGACLSEPFAVIERHRICACDAKARSRGVLPGIALAAAQALLPALRTRERDLAGETEALLGLAAWATQFTPSVAIDFPDGLALEVAGSMRLFGGLEALLQAMRAGLKEMGYSAALAAASTARAAAWLARAGEGTTAAPPSEAARMLVGLPLEVLRCPAETAEAFVLLGVRTLGELLALPREGIARRFGQRILDELDQGLGRLPDPRHYYVPPAKFSARLELPAEVMQSEALLFACKRLLAQMAAFLAGRGSGVQRFSVRLFHREGRKTELVIGLLEPSRDLKHFTVLLRERMASVKLKQPARAIELAAACIVPCGAETASLLPQETRAAGDWIALVERLRARLGDEAVQGLETAPEHRPEKASRSAELTARKPLQHALHFGERPFWLLGTPRPLEERGATPHFEGPLQLVCGPERIESGWWEGGESGDIGRDYFIARTGCDALVWIYREHRALDGGRWYLHGLFA